MQRKFKVSFIKFRILTKQAIEISTSVWWELKVVILSKFWVLRALIDRSLFSMKLFMNECRSTRTSLSWINLLFHCICYEKCKLKTELNTHVYGTIFNSLLIRCLCIVCKKKWLWRTRQLLGGSVSITTPWVSHRHTAIDPATFASGNGRR